MTEIDADAFTAFEAQGWDRSAQAYERYLRRVTDRFTQELLAATRAGSRTRLLDVACGPGHVAARAAELGADAVGLDLAAGMVELAARLHPRLEFVQGSADALPFDDRAFDAVVGGFVVLHLARPEQAAAEFARVLAPGGRVALTVWDAPARCRLFGVVLEAIAAAGAMPPADLPTGPDVFRFSDDDEFSRLLRDAGFEDVDVRTVEFEHRFAASDDVWIGFTEGSVRTRALIASQSEETRAAIRRQLDVQLDPHRSDGGYDVPVSAKLASGRRP